MPSTLVYPFTPDDMDAAGRYWGANCGPAALAFALQIHIDSVRNSLRGFSALRYTSPTMMRSGLALHGRSFRRIMTPTKADMYDVRTSIVLVQWEGPWTEPGASVKWAMMHTHWIVTWVVPVRRIGDAEFPERVFDVNTGIVNPHEWESEMVQSMREKLPRFSGGWHPREVYRL